jgi:outer membrane biosynthesis protein TonB
LREAQTVRKPTIALNFVFLMFAASSCSVAVTDNRDKNEIKSNADSEAALIPEGAQAASVMTVPADVAPESKQNPQQLGLVEEPVAEPLPPKEDPTLKKPAEPQHPEIDPIAPAIELMCAHKRHQESPHQVPEKPHNKRKKVDFAAKLSDAKGNIIAAFRSEVHCARNVIILRRLPRDIPLVLSAIVTKGRVAYVGESEPFTFKGEMVRINLEMKKMKIVEEDKNAVVDVTFKD